MARDGAECLWVGHMSGVSSEASEDIVFAGRVVCFVPFGACRVSLARMRMRTGQSVKALSDSMMQAVQAANMRNVLSVLGLTRFGVFVLYVVFITMLLFSVLFLIWAVRSESNRRFLYLNTLFMTSMTAMAYLTMATGHGIFVLRKVDGSWHFSNPLFANPVPPCLPPPLPASPPPSSLSSCLFSRPLCCLLRTPLLLLRVALVWVHATQAHKVHLRTRQRYHLHTTLCARMCVHRRARMIPKKV
jgi:bacteriorhodopsin